MSANTIQSCTCGLREHIQKMIDKATKELKQLENLETPMAEELFHNQERYEYLDNLRSKLIFMLKYPEREQIV